MKVFNIQYQMISNFDHAGFLQRSPCCPQLTNKEAFSFWPRPKQGDVIPEETLALALKWFQTRFKLQGFNFKISKKTKNLTLLQLIFTHGVKSPIMKSMNETEDNI
jgi:hypothetical protein